MRIGKVHSRYNSRRPCRRHRRFHLREWRSNGCWRCDWIVRRGVFGVKAIGLGVNENEVCLDALEIGDWDVFLLAGRYTLLEQTALDALYPACRAAGTTLICGGPFNSGILAGREMWNYAKAPQTIVDKARALGAVADQFSVPLAAAAIQFPLGDDLVTSVIPGPRSKHELDEIVDWFNTPIPEEFWATLKAEGLLDEAVRTPAGRA